MSNTVLGMIHRMLLFALLFIQQGAAEYRIYWVDIWNPGLRTQAQADAMLAAAAQSKANAVFIQARGEGHAFFLKRLEPLPQPGWTYQQGFDAISYITDKGHILGLEVHVWMDLTPLWNSDRGYNPADPLHKWHRHGEHIAGSELWMTATETSNYMQGNVDLGHPGAAKHVADVVVDPLRHYNIDGIHLDYIRYPYAVDLSNDGIWNPEFFGWNPTSIERFNRLNGKTGKPSQNDPAWQNWRRSQVTNVVRQIYLRAKEIRPSAKVSAAVTVWGAPPSGENFQNTEPYKVGFQDWHGWLQEGIVDFVMPMLYRKESDASGKSNFDAWLNWFAQHKHGREIVPGIGAYMNSIPSTLAQIDRVLAHAGDFQGFGLFSYATTNNAGITNAEFYKTLSLQWAKAPVPSFGWMSTPENGGIVGQLASSDGVLSTVDGMTAEIRRSTDHVVVKAVTIDGTGFFGSSGIGPGSYYIVWKRSGIEVSRSSVKVVHAGLISRFDALLQSDAGAKTNPDPLNCTYTISPIAVSIPAAGGTAMITVHASHDACEWIASGSLSWGVTLDGSTSRTGSATLKYNVVPNVGDTRDGSIQIGDSSVVFTQEAAIQTPPSLLSACTYTITPRYVTMSAAGGVSSVRVVASQPSCQWTATRGFTWGISLDGPVARSGSATLNYTFTPNLAETRNAYIRLGDSTIRVTQFGK